MTDLRSIAPAALADARIQLHWAAQLLSAGADALVEHAADDSHSNLAVDGARGLMIGRPGRSGQRVALDLAGPAVLVIGEDGEDRFALAGRTLEEARLWLAKTLGESLESTPELTFRDYDMPAHPVHGEGKFAIPEGHGAALALWFAMAADEVTAILKTEGSSGEVRVWPHHFDLGGLLVLDESRSIGIGLSPGDGTVAEPYWYVTAWPKPEQPTLPTLSVGYWHTEGYVGAILTGSDLLEMANPSEASAAFLREAVSHCRDLLR
jgi:hypothetical protein